MSARAVTDRDAVLRAMEEHARLGRDAFLARYGFVQSKRYEVIHEGARYDPRAIVAVAHREQHGRVLAPGEVKGATRVLADLGFEIFDATPTWSEDEMVLALEVYLRHRGQRISRTSREALQLSEALRRLAGQRGYGYRLPFRNPEGMEQQLGKFLDLDPTSTIAGRGDPSKLHRQVWDRYANDEVALRRRVAEIVGSSSTARSGSPKPDRLPPQARDAPSPRNRHKVSREELCSPFEIEAEPELAEAAMPSQVDVAAQHRANTMHRTLRLELARSLQAQGFTCHDPPKGRTDLRYDLLAVREGLTLLVEIKSLPPGADDRAQLRPGLGQVLWYRGRWREDCADPCVAVLYVEHEPAEAETWLAVCASASVVLSWRERLGTLVEECARISTVAWVHHE